MKPLSSSLSRALRSLGLESKVRQMVAIEAWSQVMGPRLVQEARAVKLERGVLTVDCGTPAMRHQLSLDRARLLERLAEILGPGAVREVKLRLG
ncbi:MAG: DUF721 domain-containing protein [Candidatus Dormibacteria bacterium]